MSILDEHLSELSMETLVEIAGGYEKYRGGDDMPEEHTLFTFTKEVMASNPRGTDYMIVAFRCWREIAVRLGADAV